MLKQDRTNNYYLIRYLYLFLCYYYIITANNLLYADIHSDLRGDLRVRSFFYLHYNKQEDKTSQDIYALEIRARPELVLNLTPSLSFVLTVDGSKNFGRFEDISGSGGFKVERAFVDYQKDKWDFRLGRQAINMGSALIWNPIDLVDSRSAVDFSSEKAGVDAIKIAYSINPTLRILGFMAFPQSIENNSTTNNTTQSSSKKFLPMAIIKAEGAWKQITWSLITAHKDSDSKIVGFEIKGDLELGYLIEAGLHFPSSQDSFYQFVAGIDYSFPVLDRLSLTLQYHRDSSGKSKFSEYDYQSYINGSRYFLSQNYASLSADLGISDSTKLQGNFIINLNDLTHVSMLGLNQNFGEHLETNIRTQFLWGKNDGEFRAKTIYHPMYGNIPVWIIELLALWRF